MERKDRTISASREEWKITFLGRLSKRAIRQWRNLKARKTETIREMSSAGFRVDLLPETAHLPLSTYYYHFKQLWGLDKDKMKFKLFLLSKKEITAIIEWVLNGEIVVL